MNTARTPWAALKLLKDGSVYTIFEDKAGSNRIIAHVSNKDDAQLIANAVNNHHDLVDALTAIVLYFNNTVAHNIEPIENARLAIKKTKGK